MTPLRRNVLGFLSVWPLVYLPVVMVGGLGIAAGSIALESGALVLSEATLSALGVAVFGGMAIGHLSMFATLIGLTFYYAWDALTRTEWSHETRLLWTLVVMAGNILAFPLYWWVNVREGGQLPAAA